VTPLQTRGMHPPIPTKPAFRVNPGDLLMEGEPKMVTGVSWKPAKDEVSLSLGSVVRTYRLEDRVPCLPPSG
jgi:hypothetical protein